MDDASDEDAAGDEELPDLAAFLPKGELASWSVQVPLSPGGESAASSPPSGRPRQPDSGTPHAQEPAKLLADFIRWVLPRWTTFWHLFRADGTMGWPEFEEFVRSGGSCGKQFQLGKWSGSSRDVRRVFELLSDGSGTAITTRACLEARRHFERDKDVATSGLDGLRRHLLSQFGSLARAWRCVLDTESTGRCCQAGFLRGCAAVGFRGNLKTAWVEITHGEVARSVTLRDLDPEGDVLLAQFALALATVHGTLKAGWTDIMRRGYGRLDLAAFTDACRSLGLTGREAKRLFMVLDPRNAGYIPEDRMEFLALWDPGEQAGLAPMWSPRRRSLDSAAGLLTLPDTTAQPLTQRFPEPSASSSGMEDDGVVGIDVPALAFEFTVVLNKQEYREYLRRRRDSRVQRPSGGRGSPLTSPRKMLPGPSPTTATFGKAEKPSSPQTAMDDSPPPSLSTLSVPLSARHEPCGLPEQGTLGWHLAQQALLAGK